MMMSDEEALYHFSLVFDFDKKVVNKNGKIVTMYKIISDNPLAKYGFNKKEYQKFLQQEHEEEMNIIVTIKCLISLSEHFDETPVYQKSIMDELKKLEDKKLICQDQNGEWLIRVSVLEEEARKKIQGI